MKTLVSVILVLFGLSLMIAAAVQIRGGDTNLGDQISQLVGGVIGAGLVISGPAIGRGLPWAPPLALFNLAVMAVLSLVNAFYLKGEIHATHHVTRALLALFLILTILRMKRSGSPE